MSSEVERSRVDASSREIRRARLRRLLRRLTLWVVLPTVAGIIYYGLIAAPQYDSVGLVSLQSSKDAKVVIMKRDSKSVKEYMLSRDMFQHLLAGAGWFEHFNSKGDRWSKMSSSAGPEEQYRYFRDKVKVSYLDDTGSLELRVRAFSGKDAQKFASAIIAASETMLASQYEDLIAGDLALAEEQATKASAALTLADQALGALLQRQSEQPATGAIVAEIDSAHFQVELARKRLEDKLAARDQAQVLALEGKQRLVTISAPSQPSKPSKPRRLWGITTVFVLSLVSMAVFSMLGAAVREHARF